MLTYKNTVLIFAVVIAALVSVDYYTDLSLYFYLIATLLFISIIFYGSYFVDSGFFIPVVCYGNETRKEVSLTFDDGPLEGKTEKILDVLKKNDIQAAFFCIGTRIKEHPHLVERMEKEGHVVGNHSFTHHFFFDLFGKNRMKKELTDTNKLIEDIIHHKPLLFRPPYGVTTPVLAKAIRATSMMPIGWSLRTMDTVLKYEEQLVQKIKRKIQPGDIILLHDSSSITQSGLQKIIDTIKQQGYSLVRIDKLLNIKAYA